MIEIRPLTTFSLADFTRIASGYISPARYMVRKEESDAQTTFTLTLEPLAVPYAKTWPTTAEDVERYTRVVQEGLSLGAYDGDLAVGLGIAAAQRWNATLWVWEFHIAGPYRGQGLGLQLMDALAEQGRTAGFRIMVCETQSTNVPAIRFYRRAGFEIGGVDLSYYTNADLPNGEVALFMKRQLL